MTFLLYFGVTITSSLLEIQHVNQNVRNQWNSQPNNKRSVFSPDLGTWWGRLVGCRKIFRFYNDFSCLGLFAVQCWRWRNEWISANQRRNLWFRLAFVTIKSTKVHSNHNCYCTTSRLHSRSRKCSLYSVHAKHLNRYNLNYSMKWIGAFQLTLF